jgi:hypothetical protein
MTDKQPEALRLADELEAMFGHTEIDDRVSAELRRLHDLLGKATALNRIRLERVKELERALADEREACARVCEAHQNMVVARHPARVEFDPNDVMAKLCAAAIRARGEG